jgi:hypothetical protein
VLTRTFQLTAVATVAALVTVGASPVQAGNPAYGGIGATIAHFKAEHANRPGNPPAGTTYYRIDRTRDGRVETYHVVVGWKSKRNTSELLERLTGRELPGDAKLVQAYNGYCATYQSRWLGRVIGLPYIRVYAPKHIGSKGVWNAVWAEQALAPPCKG